MGSFAPIAFLADVIVFLNKLYFYVGVFSDLSDDLVEAGLVESFVHPTHAEEPDNVCGMIRP